MAVVVLVVMGSLAVSCSKGGKGGKSGDWDGPMAYDEEGNQKPCPEPETQCEDRKEPSLAFKDACSVGGFRMQLCGCEELCTGNATGAKSGYDRKNKKKDCAPPKETCPEGSEESAAFQDACSEAGGQLVECGCEWLCTSKLKEAIPDPAPEEKKDEASKEGDKKDGDKKGDDKDGDKKDEKKSDKKSDKKKSE
jgi:hypothetical protein